MRLPGPDPSGLEPLKESVGRRRTSPRPHVGIDPHLGGTEYGHAVRWGIIADNHSHESLRSPLVNFHRNDEIAVIPARHAALDLDERYEEVVLIVSKYLEG